MHFNNISHLTENARHVTTKKCFRLEFDIRTLLVGHNKLLAICVSLYRHLNLSLNAFCRNHELSVTNLACGFITAVSNPNNICCNYFVEMNFCASFKFCANVENESSFFGDHLLLLCILCSFCTHPVSCWFSGFQSQP